MDLLIFNPPRYSNGHHHKFNNATLWLASYLHRRGVGVLIVPLTDENFAETIHRELEQHRPKHVAVSCKWWDTLYSATNVASLVKAYDPEIVTIAGGQTATFFAEDLVGQTDFDVVVRGDGEEPLYRLVSGERPVNCVFKDGGDVLPVLKGYVQSNANLHDTYLVEDLEQIISDTSVLNSYIWTGKGCAETCAYCSANAWNNARSFGRVRQIYRPVEQIVREMEILARYPGSSRVTFDFDPVRGNVEESYHLELFAAIEPGKYNCYFCSWSLPTNEVIDALAETFNFVELCIDVQTCSDRLRKFLGDSRYLKPHFSDEALENTLRHVEQYDNFTVDLSTLMGLPFETDEDVTKIQVFSDYFYDNFADVRYPYVSPMNVEPGSLLMRDPDRYEMVLFRKNFSDFLAYTKRSFDNNINCYQPSSYGDGVFHPLGTCPKRDYENGDYFRVYEIWKEIQENVDRRSQEKMVARARKYKKYGLTRAGILGGVDRPTLARSNVE